MTSILEKGDPEVEEQKLSNYFDSLPPEMVTSIFEHLENSAPSSLLSCRLTCHRFKCLIDDLLQKQQVSLWNPSSYYGEAKPFIHPGPLRRPLPVNKIFSKTADITDFLNDMKTSGHLSQDDNPFPNKSIYLRRVKSNPPAPTTENDNLPDSDNLEADADTGTPRNRVGFLGGLALGDNPKENEAYLLSLQKINLLLTPFGGNLTSLIFECGVTTDLKSLEDVGNILERVPNLQYLMLKGLRVPQKEGPLVEHLPQLPYLKSVKVIRCHGVIESLIYSYHDQLECLQIINSRDNYLPQLNKLVVQQSKSSGDRSDQRGLIFGKLRELKFGELQTFKELDHFVKYLKGEEGVDLLPKLDHLSLQYNLLGRCSGDKLLTKLFEPLEYIRRLKEFNVGVCGDTEFGKIEEENGENGGIFGGGGNMKVRRLSVPVQLIRYPDFVERVVRGMGGLEVVRFLRNGEEGHGGAGGREEFSEGMEEVLKGMLRGFGGLNKVEIVDVVGDREIIICGAVRK